MDVVVEVLEPLIHDRVSAPARANVDRVAVWRYEEMLVRATWWADAVNGARAATQATEAAKTTNLRIFLPLFCIVTKPLISHRGLRVQGGTRTAQSTVSGLECW